MSLLVGTTVINKELFAVYANIEFPNNVTMVLVLHIPGNLDHP